MAIHRRILVYIKASFLTAFFLFPQGLFVNSQILLDSPIEGVRLTMFSDEGYKLWFLRGQSATYLEAGSVAMSDLDLEVFNESETPTREMHILGSNAIYKSNDRTVSGDGGVFVNGGFYLVEGESWDYSQENKTIKVASNVKVLIDYEIPPFFK